MNACRFRLKGLSRLTRGLPRGLKRLTILTEEPSCFPPKAGNDTPHVLTVHTEFVADLSQAPATSPKQINGALPKTRLEVTEAETAVKNILEQVADLGIVTRPF